MGCDVCMVWAKCVGHVGCDCSLSQFLCALGVGRMCMGCKVMCMGCKVSVIKCEQCGLNVIEA